MSLCQVAVCLTAASVGVDVKTEGLRAGFLVGVFVVLVLSRSLFGS